MGYGNVQNARKNLQEIVILFNKMATYKCFKCGKKVTDKNLEKRFLCPFCGSKIFFKPRTKVKMVKAE
jgi:DNA-directed RNA polymerase subunit RPC12/RpoP